MGKILVTGSNGYLGNRLNELKKGENYIFLDLGLFSTNYEKYNKLDLRTAKYKEIFSQDVDIVVHLAGVSNDPSSELLPELTEQMNVEASKRLIDFSVAHGVKKFIFASSASVYGYNPVPCTENSTLNPISIYAKSKIEVENYLQTKPELSHIIFRFGTLFGYSPKMRFDLAVNLMVKDALTKGEVYIKGGGEQHRPFLFIDDAVKVILDELYTLDAYEHEVFNMATCNIRIKYLAEIIASLTDSKVVYDENQSPDRRDYMLNTEKAQDNLMIYSPISLESGIIKLIESLKTHMDYTIGTNSLDCVDFYTVKAWKKWIEEGNK